MKIYHVRFDLSFPAGLAAGESSNGNLKGIARDGAGRLVLRGTAVAGVLRSAYASMTGGDISNREKETSKWFGNSHGGEAGSNTRFDKSSFEVGDILLKAEGAFRTHNMRDRHTGSVVEGGLFSLEHCTMGAEGEGAFWLRVDEDLEEDNPGTFIADILSLLHTGLLFGGCSNRGIGMGVVKDAWVQEYDLTEPESHARYLDDHRAWRTGDASSYKDRMKKADLVSRDSSDKRLRIDLKLTIPRGQDLLVGDGQGIYCESEPQRVVRSGTNEEYWVLPGSTLRGAFRSWMNRLAARDKEEILDSHARRQQALKDNSVWNGDLLGWLFLDKNERKNPAERQKKAIQRQNSDPVYSLFGSLAKAGRIHISDAYSKIHSPDENILNCSNVQKRMHVAVDALTGGAIEHMLFDSAVLTAPSSAPVQFDVKILVEDPTEKEVTWLCKTIRALDMGLIRIGSSKSSGRLCLTQKPQATGRFAELIQDYQPLAKGAQHA